MDVSARFLARLGCHSKQTGNEPGLMSAVSFAYPVHLPLPNHVHHFVPLQCSPRRLKGEKAQSWPDQSFDEAVVLLHEVVEIFDRS